MLLARNIAVAILERIRSGDRTLDQLLAQSDPEIQRLHRRDRALLHAIVYGVLRWRERLDWVIDHLASRPGRKIDPLVRVILRMGVFQMHHLDRIPPSAAVHTSVELAKKNKRKWASGFVNGVLRGAAVKGKNIPWPDRRVDPVAYLSVYHSFPRWLICRWIDQWGMDDVEALCSAINAIPKITLRTNTLQVSRQALLDWLQSKVKGTAITNHSPEGISFSSPHHPIVQWEAYGKGWFQIQSEASQLIAHLLCARPGHDVWDACAGLGSQSEQDW